MHIGLSSGKKRRREAVEDAEGEKEGTEAREERERQEEQTEEHVVNQEPLFEDLITFSSVPRSRLHTLTHLETVKVRVLSSAFSPHSVCLFDDILSHR
jgi:hypothetical protein